jgi:hypothetical protein
MKPYPQSLIVWLIGMACILYAVSQAGCASVDYHSKCKRDLKDGQTMRLKVQTEKESLEYDCERGEL